jgi:hypothetical protein
VNPETQTKMFIIFLDNDTACGGFKEIFHDNKTSPLPPGLLLHTKMEAA